MRWAELSWVVWAEILHVFPSGLNLFIKHDVLRNKFHFKVLWCSKNRTAAVSSPKIKWRKLGYATAQGIRTVQCTGFITRGSRECERKHTSETQGNQCLLSETLLFWKGAFMQKAPPNTFLRVKLMRRILNSSTHPKSNSFQIILFFPKYLGRKKKWPSSQPCENFL